jgi:polyribonucleotide nucleotidyltransferase
MYKTFSTVLGERNLSVEIGRYAELASGAVCVHYGETVVLVTVTRSDKPREGIDFFPLVVDYEERLYSVGKIPGGFIKREGKPTEKAILISRLIDRAFRPLFPKDYKNDVAIVATVLSVDQDCLPEIASMIGTSIALNISDIPFKETIAGINVGLINNKLIVNPKAAEREISDLSLTVASSSKKIVMIEAGANQVSDNDMYDAIMFADKENKKLIKFIKKLVNECGTEKKIYVSNELSNTFYEGVVNLITEEKMFDLMTTESKQERGQRLKDLFIFVKENIVCDILNSNIDKMIEEALYKFQKETVRKMILLKHKRPDGRTLNEIRKLSAEIDILPRTHGSALFKRGQTQVLTIATLGSMSDVQVLDGLDLLEENKRYMHHYNFPSFSVGETKPSRGPGRREIGHGALAERALLPVVPSEEKFPYAIRLVSEVLSSNGSTSQASVCASSLSLMAAGVPISSHVAGISIGLITSEDENNFVLLTDIQGLEDFFGDMDFKIAGTKKGITAIQLDIKIDGLTPEIIKLALEKAHRARNYIIDEVMSKCINRPKKNISQYAPKIIKIKIDPDRMSEIIGARGKTIRRIIEESGVDKIDTEDDGRIFIVSYDQKKVDIATKIIEAIIKNPEPGDVFYGKVTKIMNFGAFVEIAPEKEGLVHISKLSTKRINAVEDVVKLGDMILVKVINIDEQGRINLACTNDSDSHKQNKK